MLNTLITPIHHTWVTTWFKLLNTCNALYGTVRVHQNTPAQIYSLKYMFIHNNKYFDLFIFGNATVLIYLVSSLRLIFLVVYRFPVWSLIFARISLICTPKSLATIFPCVVPRAWCTYGGWGGVLGWCGGVPGLLHIFTRAWNLTHQPDSRFQILDPNPAPFTTGDWRVELRGWYVSRILRPWFWFDHLPAPVLAKGICPFSLP